MVVAVAALGFTVWVASPLAVSFSNTAPIVIPTGPGNGTPYPSSITVAGLAGTVKKVKVTLINFSHTFPDDVGVVLVAPGGQALLLMDGAGDDPDVVNVTLTFADGAPVLPDSEAPTSGTYKPTTYYTGDSFPAPGPLLAYDNPGPAGGGTATFASTFAGASPNGTWNLFVRDMVSGDAGSIAGGWSLTLVTEAPVDFDGNAVTDFAVVRNTGGGPSGAVTWYWWNGAGLSGRAWGIASDFFVPGDFDADGKTDVSVWRPGSPGIWYVNRSTDLGVMILAFGQSGDDPTIIGDYDGDGKTDMAVYRNGATTGAPSFWHIWRSTTGTPLSMQWGQRDDFPAPGDYDGDHKHDFAVQRDAGGGQAVFYISLSGGGMQTLFWGTPADVIVPGDYDGDGKTDLAVVRAAGGSIQWHVRRSSDGGYSPFTFGASATDVPTAGDYDGDGVTDVAVWRPDANPALTAFYVLWSSDGSLHAMQFGQNGDYPIANFNVH